MKQPIDEGFIEPTTALGDWHATALFWKPQVVLLVNERTLLPVIVPLAPAARHVSPDRELLVLVETWSTRPKPTL